MATYKVPQDVEADDKLLGPFSFRQFVYLVIVALAIGFAWLLGQIFIGLIFIPMPIIFFFGALALPLKKDQPMEAYLGALISFYFIKPRKRLWVPDGINSLVEITAPQQVEPERTKNISQHEAAARLSYLTDIIDSRGWAVRGTGVPTHGISSMNNAMYAEAQDATDMLGDAAGAQRFDRLLEQQQQKNINTLSQNIQRSQNAAAEASTPPQQAATPQTSSATTEPVSQTTIATPSPIPQNPTTPSIAVPLTEPLAPSNTSPEPQASHPQGEDTSIMAASPAIIKLANTSEGLTVADVAKQAERINTAERGLPEDEVSISLH